MLEPDPETMRHLRQHDQNGRMSNSDIERIARRVTVDAAIDGLPPSRLRESLEPTTALLQPHSEPALRAPSGPPRPRAALSGGLSGVTADASADHVAKLRAAGITPHVTQNNGLTKTGRQRRSAIDGRTIRHGGYAASQSRRPMIECIFG